MLTEEAQKSLLTDEAYKDLEEAVGPENVSREPALLDSYAFQSFAFLESIAEGNRWCPRPEAVVLPKSTEEVQAVVKICNRHKIKFKAHSTGWGALGAPGGDGVIQIDLRRMDRILEIDEKNMYAVVEPYAIAAQVQAEVMKRGLNLHIIGAGSGHSPLASITSVWGMGWSSIYMSYSARNALAVEWVLPDGNILNIGTLGAETGWFCGDGPGPSLRGIMRGYIGALGALGVFTKCAIKLYNWPGPSEPRIDGLIFDVKTEVPETHKVYLCNLPSYEKYGEALYKIDEAEIGYIQCKEAIGLILDSFTPRLMRKIVKTKAIREVLAAFQHMFEIILAGSTKRELEYQEMVLKEIASDTDGMLIELSGLPPLNSMFWWGFSRASLPPIIFRYGGSFGMFAGGEESIEHGINQSKFGEEIKNEFIEKGVVLDDLGDSIWGGLYEHNLIFHQEELFQYDPRTHLKEAGELQTAGISRFADRNYNISFILPLAAKIIGIDKVGSKIHNFHIWQKKVKDTFDRNGISDPSYYLQKED